MTKYRITLDFETDDSITLGMLTHSLECTNAISKVLISEFPNATDNAVAYKIVEARETTFKYDIEELLNEKISFDYFSVRSVNCMKASDIETIRDLVRHRNCDLERFRNFGKKSLEELDNFIKDHGLHWGMNV